MLFLFKKKRKKGGGENPQDPKQSCLFLTTHRKECVQVKLETKLSHQPVSDTRNLGGPQATTKLQLQPLLSISENTLSTFPVLPASITKSEKILCAIKIFS